MDMVCSSCRFANRSVTVISFSTRRLFKTSGKKAVTHPGKYVNLLVGQLDEDDLRYGASQCGAKTRKT